MAFGEKNKMTSDVVRVADDFAEKAHTGHTVSNNARKPYIHHLREVAELVRQSGGSEEEICAALLHDSVEDTETTLEDIEALLGSHVRELVDALTDPEGAYKLPTLERKTNQALRVRGESNAVKRIKLADQISNVRTVASDPPMKWNKQKCKDYIEGARRISEECKNISMFLNEEFQNAYQTAKAKYP